MALGGRTDRPGHNPPQQIAAQPDTNRGEAVLHEADQIQAGLVVMGGYHHNRTRELRFGGTTRDVLFASKIPVLLAH